MRRAFQHLLYFPWRMRQSFPRPVLKAIEQEIAASERHHSGELRVAIEGHLDVAQLLHGTTARQRAQEVFSLLRVWDTEHNSGVLIYLLLAERRVEIVADRGIDAKVGPEFWEQVCLHMRDAFQRGEFEAGVLQGIRTIDARLQEHFPAAATNPNELPDRPLLL